MVGQTAGGAGWVKPLLIEKRTSGRRPRSWSQCRVRESRYDGYTLLMRRARQWLVNVTLTKPALQSESAAT